MMDCTALNRIFRLERFKRILAFCFILLFCLPLNIARAQSVSFAAGDCSDDVLRAETRLSDLGYLCACVDGRWDEADETAFSSFALANGVSGQEALARLFSQEAIPPPAEASGLFSTTSGVLLVGTRMPWSDAEALLIAGETYSVTSCKTGIILHMIYVEGGAHAEMRPVLEWDEATLSGFFDGRRGFETHPVIVTVDNIRIAASISANIHTLSDGTSGCCVYFIDSTSKIGGISDTQHDASVLLAGGM